MGISPNHRGRDGRITRARSPDTLLKALVVVAPGGALSLWARLIDGQRAVADLGTVEFCDCPSRRLVTGQLHKAKPLALACVAVCDQAYVVHLPIGGKQL